MRAIIIDDERPAREGIQLRLRDEPDIEVVGETGEARAAIEMIQSVRPDLVFLDINLRGEMDGLEVLRRASAEHLPAVIFTTAYHQYAVSAFEANAIDYLLKPYTAKRFKEAIERVRAQQVRGAALALTHDRLLRLLHHQRPEERRRRPDGASHVVRLAVRERDRFLIVKVKDVDWIHAAANYAELHSNSRVFLLRSTMGELEEKLDPRQFIRIHRATIVNVDRIEEVVPSAHGDHVVQLSDKTRLRLSRTHRDRLMSMMYPYLREDPEE